MISINRKLKCVIQWFCWLPGDAAADSTCSFSLTAHIRTNLSCCIKRPAVSCWISQEVSEEASAALQSKTLTCCPAPGNTCMHKHTTRNPLYAGMNNFLAEKQSWQIGTSRANRRVSSVSGHVSRVGINLWITVFHFLWHLTFDCFYFSKPHVPSEHSALSEWYISWVMLLPPTPRCDLKLSDILKEQRELIFSHHSPLLWRSGTGNEEPAVCQWG